MSIALPLFFRSRSSAVLSTAVPTPHRHHTVHVLVTAYISLLMIICIVLLPVLDLYGFFWKSTATLFVSLPLLAYIILFAMLPCKGNVFVF